MPTSLEYDKQANNQIDNIDRDGVKAIETAKIYARLSLAAAIREQNEIIRLNNFQFEEKENLYE
jgi:hypothetical protein